MSSVKGATVRRDMALLSRICSVAMSEWSAPWPDNPFSKVRRPQDSRPRRRRYMDGEETRLLAACDAARAPYLRALVELAVETAMRQGELVSLDWAHVNLEQSSAHLPMTKNGLSRTVPLSAKAIGILARSAARYGDNGKRIGKVFPGLTGEAVKRAFSAARRTPAIDCSAGVCDCCMVQRV
ncbi:site-specific integrase [Paraburkholderia phytofirmans]|uniref:site-specific integrase n=1 Tax=Paraburkholderia phytofirmans TaxID=261302 RepID=UPI001427DE64|nr:site-specific integrase [Paraburkholderia phytofirmans]